MVWEQRRQKSSAVRYPKSRAARAEVSQRPILVGEVRGATSMCSESCELSGGSQFIAGPTRSSKKRQVRRARVRRKALLAFWKRWRLWLADGAREPLHEQRRERPQDQENGGGREDAFDPHDDHEDDGESGDHQHLAHGGGEMRVGARGAFGGLPFEQMMVADPAAVGNARRSRPPKARPGAAGRRS